MPCGRPRSPRARRPILPKIRNRGIAAGSWNPVTVGTRPGRRAPGSPVSPTFSLPACPLRSRRHPGEHSDNAAVPGDHGHRELRGNGCAEVSCLSRPVRDLGQCGCSARSRPKRVQHREPDREPAALSVTRRKSIEVSARADPLVRGREQERGSDRTAVAGSVRSAMSGRAPLRMSLGPPTAVPGCRRMSTVAIFAVSGEREAAPPALRRTWRAAADRRSRWQ